MRIAEELHIGKPLEPGHELALSVLLTREHLTRLMEERIFRPAELTDSQFNVLRILKGGPTEGYAIGELRQRIISRSADVPRLVDRLVAMGLVDRLPHPQDRRSCRVRLTARGDARQGSLSLVHASLLRELEGLLPEAERTRLLDLLERLREGMRALADRTRPIGPVRPQ